MLNYSVAELRLIKNNTENYLKLLIPAFFHHLLFTISNYFSIFAAVINSVAIHAFCC